MIGWRPQVIVSANKYEMCKKPGEIRTRRFFQADFCWVSQRGGFGIEDVKWIFLCWLDRSTRETLLLRAAELMHRIWSDDGWLPPAAQHQIHPLILFIETKTVSILLTAHGQVLYYEKPFTSIVAIHRDYASIKLVIAWFMLESQPRCIPSRCCNLVVQEEPFHPNIRRPVSVQIRAFKIHMPFW